MAVNSPNEERINDFEERILERFDHEKMQDWPLDRLHEARLLIENEFKMFKISFPGKESVMQGQVRAWAYDKAEDDKHALTDEERLRLRDIKRTALGEVYRAEGRRKDEKREHRLKLYNTAVDSAKVLSNVISSALPPW